MTAAQQNTKDNRSLRDFTRLALAFYGTLLILALYQNLRLYALGVLDGLIGKSLFLLFLHHLGFAALVTLPMSFLFKFLERKKPGIGFRITGLGFLLLLLMEGVLIDFYVGNYEILGPGFIEVYSSRTSVADFMLSLAILFPLCISVFYLFYKISSSTYKIIGRMYPFTIILFTLFLATLYSDKKPVNENKTHHLIVHATAHALDLNKYEGAEEFPLAGDYEPDNSLAAYFELKKEMPNLVFVVLEGIGSDFVGENASFRGITPFLDSLTKSSLYWPRHLSNTGESHASLPSILGSLPFGESGFNKSSASVNRNTILGALKKSGYYTAFYYGGNTALNQWDKFLFEDRIDYLLDVKGFGDSFKKQDEDAAGISLGYPDTELYRKWEQDRSDYQSPFAEVFFTLSSKMPFQIPDEDKYSSKAREIAKNLNWGARESKILRKNEEVFASIIYADEAFSSFMKKYSELPEYDNTIFIITGSHNLIDIPVRNGLSRYAVPLIIHSPLIKAHTEFGNLSSHADILPSILGLLHTKYKIKSPRTSSFVGKSLVTLDSDSGTKQIPLYRHTEVMDFILGNVFVSGGDHYLINQNMSLTDFDDDELVEQADKAFGDFKAINKYVTRQNKLIPEDQLLFARTAREPNKQEMIWINSVFNGADFDNAYQTARSLALDGDYDRALLLSSYILNEVPGHADTEILMGRIYAWSGSYDRAAEILEGAILKYPVYADAYSALLDVYFWSGQNIKVIQLRHRIKRYGIQNKELDSKIERAFGAVDQEVQSSRTSSKDDQPIDGKSVVQNQFN